MNIIIMILTSVTSIQLQTLQAYATPALCADHNSSRTDTIAFHDHVIHGSFYSQYSPRSIRFDKFLLSRTQFKYGSVCSHQRTLQHNLEYFQSGRRTPSFISTVFNGSVCFPFTTESARWRGGLRMRIALQHHRSW